jgi:hypothetical protein
MKWEDIKGLAVHGCLSFAKTTGFDMDELLSEAQVAYMKTYTQWERNREAKFSTLFVTTLRNHLTDYCYNEGNRRKPLTMSEELMDYHQTSGGDSTAHQAMFNLTLQRMSHEAQIVVRIVFNTPAEVFASMADARKGRTILHPIAKHLKRTLGWSRKKSTAVFEEVRTALQASA